MKEAKRTPGPWQVLPGADYDLPGQNIITDETATRVIASLDDDEDRDKANAAFIVKAGNAHDALVAALENLCDSGEAYMKYHERKFYGGKHVDGIHKPLAKARAALAHAKEKAK